MATAARPQHEDTNVITMLRDEIEAINERRHELKREKLPVRAGCEPPVQVIDAVGLALSGGGVRSAAVSLGVLQALNHHKVLRHIDYLSTVSGGGYMGASLTATMTKSNGHFVFGNPPKRGAHAPLAAEISDTDEVGHIRNYSNYLIPGGARDLITGIAIVVRGLVANLGLLLPVVLLLAALMIWSNPDRTALLSPNLFGYKLDFLPVDHFGVALLLALAGLVLFFLWALYRSVLVPPDKSSEFRTKLPFLGGFFLVVLAATFFCELQPFIVAGMFDVADGQVAAEANPLVGLATGWVKTLAAITAPIAAVVMFFRQQLGAILKSASSASAMMPRIMAVVVKGAVWVAGAALPLLIWVAFLYLCYWGIINIKTDRQDLCPPPGTISGTVSIDDPGLKYSGKVEGKLQLDGRRPCPAGAEKREMVEVEDGSHTPHWLLTGANFLSRWASRFDDAVPFVPKWLHDVVKGRFINRPMILLYLCAGLLLLVLSLLLTPNANSLHRLYRDRLSKAFLFDPKLSAGPRRIKRNEASIDQGRDFAPLDDLRLSQLSAKHAPYHLINAALNIQGSDYANRRGRNADFFLFSPRYIGSYATDYAPMKTFERACRDLDLATAMAISGAAASSNMGASSIRALTPTLALLNVRLGYWLRNPRFCSPSSTKNPEGRRWLPTHRSTLYLWSEIAGRLYENADEVYLTDGGHIENLGIYELLRRHCKVIVVVDAEADLAMHFPSFITLQRYARIDLGIRIDLPWEPIRAATLAEMQPVPQTPTPATPRKPSAGPHVAIGTIDYGGGQTGYLVYVKSSLTGDENNYIRDYARRHDRFPHESTGDQFFSEEQFEVYRALGFHMAQGFLSGDDVVCVNRKPVEGEPVVEKLKFNDASNEILATVYRTLIPAAP